jgi:hypothetical protein
MLWQTAVRLSVRLSTICRRRGRRTFGENAASVDYQPKRIADRQGRAPVRLRDHHTTAS